MATAFELTPEALAGALRVGAAGYLPLEAGIELLIRHRLWLLRRDFRPFIEYHPAEATTGGTALAFVAWDDALLCELPASASESAILRIAASLADDLPTALRTDIPGLDAPNLGLVLDAIGWANRGGDPR